MSLDLLLCTLGSHAGFSSRAVAWSDQFGSKFKDNLKVEKELKTQEWSNWKEMPFFQLKIPIGSLIVI